LFYDLSYSRCEDDLDLTVTNCGKIWKKHRPSLPAAGNPDSTKEQHSFETKQTNVVHTPAEKNNVSVLPCSNQVKMSKLLHAINLLLYDSSNQMSYFPL
jgi:hypothetical protein